MHGLKRKALLKVLVFTVAVLERYDQMKQVNETSTIARKIRSSILFFFPFINLVQFLFGEKIRKIYPLIYGKKSVVWKKNSKLCGINLVQI